MDVDVTKRHASHTNGTLPIRTVTMVLPFRFLGMGGGLGFTSCANTDNSNGDWQRPFDPRTKTIR